jgi:YkoY family integral membrane protein
MSALHTMVTPGDAFTVSLLVVLEGLLSADNAIVLAVMVLGLPSRQRHKALRYGLVGAFAFRIVTTMLAAYLIRVSAVKIVGAAYLLYLPYHHFFSGENPYQRRTPPKAKPWLGMDAFWATVVKVELANLVFSMDSILVAVAMSPKLWVILTGGMLGIVAMRVVIGRLLALVERYPALVDGAFIIIAWVGIKLLFEYLYTAGYVSFEIPRWLSLGLIVVIFAVSLVYARRLGPAPPGHDEAAQVLLEKGDHR